VQDPAALTMGIEAANAAVLELNFMMPVFLFYQVCGAV
jgi:hypothetical protein